MADQKRCANCMIVVARGHWAYEREVCPACGGQLNRWPEDPNTAPRYEHYDSNVDLRFDLSDLLTFEQQREVKSIGWVGVGLVLLAAVARMLFVLLASVEGFWGVPLWFDSIVVVMILLGCGMWVWSFRRFSRHRKALRRG